jgi:hypothetical protein
VQYPDVEKGLILANPNTIQSATDSRNQKAFLEEITAFLVTTLTEEMPRRKLTDLLYDQFDCEERSIEKKLKQIIDFKLPITSPEHLCTHLCKRTEGKEVIYYLTDSLPH